MAIVSPSKVLTAINSRKARDFMIYGIGQAVNLLSPLVVIPYIVSVCGEAALGKIGVGFSFALIAIVLVDGGSFINGTKEISVLSGSRSEIARKTATIFLAKFLLLIAVLAVSAAVIFAVPFFRRDALQMLLSLLIIAGQCLNPAWFFQGIQNFVWITIVNVISKIIYIAGVFWLVDAPGDYIYVNALLGIGMIVAALPGLAFIAANYGVPLKWKSLADSMRLIRSETALSVSQLFFAMYQYAPIILVGFVLGDHAAGLYRIVDQVIMIFRTYLQMFFNFVYADVCAGVFSDLRNGVRKWKFYNVSNSALICTTLLVFFLVPQPILLFFKLSPHDVRILAPYFRIGLLIPVLMCFSFALKQLMFAMDKNRQYIIITIAATILTLALMFGLLSVFGLVGAFVSIIFVEAAVIVSYAITLKADFQR